MRVEYIRDGLVEEFHEGLFMLSTEPYDTIPYYLRSCAKPLQATLLIDYGIDLTEEELIEKYEEIISSYRPFIVLSSMFGSVRADFIRNEDKFSKRAKRSISIFDFSEETEEHHPEIAANDLEEEAISNEMAEQVRDAIAQLKPIQRERLIKYFFEGKSLLQIAAEEGKSYSTVYESYQAALKKLKKIFENTR